MMVKLTFGEWLKDQLCDQQIDQQELAERVGVKPSAVSKWIRKGTTPRERTAHAVARELGEHPNVVRDLLGWRLLPESWQPSRSRQGAASGTPIAGSQEVLEEIREIHEEQRQQRELLETLLKRQDDPQG